MIPHIPYISPLGSYYYFRPYQAFHVRAHQEEVTSYGGDPRNPYDNRMFDNIYAELEAAWAEEDAARLGSPFEDELPRNNSGTPGIEDDVPAKPAAPDFNTQSTPAGRLRAVQKASPMTRPAASSAKDATAAVPAERRVFRAKR